MKKLILTLFFMAGCMTPAQIESENKNVVTEFLELKEINYKKFTCMDIGGNFYLFQCEVELNGKKGFIPLICRKEKCVLTGSYKDNKEE